MQEMAESANSIAHSALRVKTHLCKYSGGVFRLVHALLWRRQAIASLRRVGTAGWMRPWLGGYAAGDDRCLVWWR